MIPFTAEIIGNAKSGPAEEASRLQMPPLVVVVQKLDQLALGERGAPEGMTRCSEGKVCPERPKTFFGAREIFTAIITI